MSQAVYHTLTDYAVALAVARDALSTQLLAAYAETERCKAVCRELMEHRDQLATDYADACATIATLHAELERR